jgi:hypothetical protein
MSVLTKSLDLLFASIVHSSLSKYNQNNAFKCKKGVGCEFRPAFLMTKFIHNYSATSARSPINRIRRHVA